MSDPEQVLTKDAPPTTDRRSQAAKDRRNARERAKRAEANGGKSRKPGRPKGSGSTRRASGGGNRNLTGPLRETLIVVGGVWGSTESMRGHVEPTCGEVLIDQAPAIAEALNAVAQDDESVYLWLDRMLTGGGWGSVAFAVLPVVQAIGQAHIVPAIQRRSLARLDGTWPEEEPSPVPIDVPDAYDPDADVTPPADLSGPPNVQHGPDFDDTAKDPGDPGPSNDPRPER